MTEQQNQLPDLGKLISLVRQNEILWNKAMADHNNNKWKNAAWKKIGQEWYGGASLVESARLAQTEWYRVWRKYKSEYKKLKKHIRVMPNTPFVSSFEHFDQLSFLNPIMELCVLNDGNLSIGESSIDFDGIVQYPDPIDSINAVADQAIHDFLKEETESPCFLKEETQSPANSGLNEEDEIMGPPSGSANIHITSMHMGSGQNRAMNFSFDNHLSRKRKASTDLLSGVESMLHTCANTLVDRIYEHCANSLEGIAQTHEEKVKAAVIRKSVDPEFLRTVGNLLEKVPHEKREHVKYEDTTIQTRDRGKSYVTYPTDYVLNDTTTTTTQVEVFRAKVDRNDPIDYFKLPPDPLGPDQRPMIVRAVGPPYEVQTRTETRFSDRPVTSRPGSRVQWESETDLRSIGHGADSTLSRRSQIGSGAGQYPQIGSGVGYHQPRIGSGTSLDQRIGSGTSLNQPRIGSGTSLNQPRIGSGAEIDRPRIGSGASYNSPSPNIGYGTSAGYPLRRVGSDFDWEERRFVGPNELTSYERSRSQSPITVDPTRPSYGLRDTDTYTATILRKQWTEERDQRIQHKDNLGRRRSPSPPSGADATTYPPRIGNGVEAKRQPRQLHHTKSQQDVFQDPKRRYDYPPDYREDFRREYTTREIQKPGIQSSFSEGYERRRRESRSPDRSYIQQDQYRTRTYSPAGERYRDAHGSRKNQYDRDPPRDHHYHRSRRHSKSPDRYRRVSPRARSETRLQQQEAEGQSYRRVQNPYRAQGPTSTSPYSTLSRPRSREDATETYDLKLYQTRDCLGNILYNLRPETQFLYGYSEEEEMAVPPYAESEDSFITNMSPRKEVTKSRYESELLRKQVENGDQQSSLQKMQNFSKSTEENPKSPRKVAAGKELEKSIQQENRPNVLTFLPPRDQNSKSSNSKIEAHEPRNFHVQPPEKVSLLKSSPTIQIPRSRSTSREPRRQQSQIIEEKEVIEETEIIEDTITEKTKKFPVSRNVSPPKNKTNIDKNAYKPKKTSSYKYDTSPLRVESVKENLPKQNSQSTTLPGSKPIVLPRKNENEVLKRTRSYTEIPIHREDFSKTKEGSKNAPQVIKMVDSKIKDVPPRKPISMDAYLPKRTISYTTTKNKDDSNDPPLASSTLKRDPNRVENSKSMKNGPDRSNPTRIYANIPLDLSSISELLTSSSEQVFSRAQNRSSLKSNPSESQIQENSSSTKAPVPLPRKSPTTNSAPTSPMKSLVDQEPRFSSPERIIADALLGSSSPEKAPYMSTFKPDEATSPKKSTSTDQASKFPRSPLSSINQEPTMSASALNDTSPRSKLAETSPMYIPRPKTVTPEEIGSKFQLSPMSSKQLIESGWLSSKSVKMDTRQIDKQEKPEILQKMENIQEIPVQKVIEKISVEREKEGYMTAQSTKLSRSKPRNPMPHPTLENEQVLTRKSENPYLNESTESMKNYFYDDTNLTSIDRPLFVPTIVQLPAPTPEIDYPLPPPPNDVVPVRRHRSPAPLLEPVIEVSEESRTSSPCSTRSVSQRSTTQDLGYDSTISSQKSIKSLPDETKITTTLKTSSAKPPLPTRPMSSQSRYSQPRRITSETGIAELEYEPKRIGSLRRSSSSEESSGSSNRESSSGENVFPANAQPVNPYPEAKVVAENHKLRIFGLDE